ncbi:hypothetical protein [Bacillus sp. FJAT-26390]|uniref:hypothetical protein n=1 Tax=Bacillus sp. FJAT-26390 TaxID=1743142 RepID=UPI000807DA3B|nr:hypothetical protein [Bacillus sp. FJAT-26390]OBZ08049.1 hypothetical protein A7975_27380 [Bacillus sp. FJAT-26390]
MSTPILLSGAIKRFIEAVIADNVSQQPAVHEFYLPEKVLGNQNVPEFPYIIVRLHKGETQADGHKVIVNLYFGTKSEDAEAPKDVFNVMERVRLALLKNRTLERQFRLEVEQPNAYKWEFFEGQPSPEYIGQAITTWTIPTITEEVEGI